MFEQYQSVKRGYEEDKKKQRSLQRLWEECLFNQVDLPRIKYASVTGLCTMFISCLEGGSQDGYGVSPDKILN